MMFLPGESLQSFIFRQMAIAGSLDFSCVVDDTGSWVTRPRIPAKYQHIFHMFDEELLLEITRNSGLAPGPKSLFGNPTSAVVALSDIFAGENSGMTITNGIQIAFCEKCMESSLIENGFAYFKACWLFARDCDEHNNRLSILKPRRRGGAISAIKDILTGGSPVETTSIRKPFEKEKYIGLSFNKEQRPENPTHYMPCVIKPLLCWITDNIEKFQNNKRLKKRYWMDNLINSNLIMPHDLEKIFVELVDEEPALFRDFLKEKISNKAISFGVWDETKFSADIYKMKAKKCSSCVESMGLGICPASPDYIHGDNKLKSSLDIECLNVNNLTYVHRVELGNCRVSFDRKAD